MEEVEPRSNRQRFLRQLGVALAAGIGVVLLPGKSRAGVTAFQCCENHTFGSNWVCTSGTQFYCDCGGPSNYCTCRAPQPCFPAPC